eukprot:TRINITY_DN11076_c0_g2_i1.p1 TRINITY_DN11076_c0_g2~~TRINITY_DN11076_c0_g2_i1.p1  ORF type:complete len:177 (+),score=51.10 TRINITY_DN11076_c0_g2_i1:52-582(+)
MDANTKIEVLYSAETIAERVKQLGKEIREAYGDEPILLVGILKGCFIFLADLMRSIEGDCSVDFMGIRSYEGEESTGSIRITKDINHSLEGKHCIIVEDIVDTGLSLQFLQSHLLQLKPKSLKICVLLDKFEARKHHVEGIDFVGFKIPRKFVIGYGLDCDEKFRNLPFIGEVVPL